MNIGRQNHPGNNIQWGGGRGGQFTPFSWKHGVTETCSWPFQEQAKL